VVTNLVGDLQQWAGSYRESENSQSNRISQQSWNSAMEGLEHCVRIAEVDRTAQLLELGWVILRSASSLWGSTLVKDWTDALEALRDIHESVHIPKTDLETASATLFELEVFLGSALFTAQHAVVRVTALTKSPTSFDSSLESLARQAMEEARAVVVREVRQARSFFREEVTVPGQPTLFGIQFPEEGLWL
jgi:hypothetical protein